MHTFAVRHGIPEHTRYAENPGLEKSQRNEALVQIASEIIAAYLREDSSVGIVTSTPQRGRETGEALLRHPLLSPFTLQKEVTVSPLLDEGNVSIDPHEFGSTLRWMQVLQDLANIAFENKEVVKPVLILVTHDSVIRQLPYFNAQTVKTDPLTVNHFVGLSPSRGFGH